MTEAKQKQTTWKRFKPIHCKCPGCKKETNHYWDREIKYHGYPEGVALICGGCGWIEDPLKLGVKPFHAWIEDPENSETYMYKVRDW
jgi:hypothetical protein